MAVSKKRVPQLERDIAKLEGREFGRHSVGEPDGATPADGPGAGCPGQLSRPLTTAGSVDELAAAPCPTLGR